MKKLKLEIEDLEVSSFETAELNEQVGTVNGHSTELCSVSCTDPFSSLYKLARTFSALCEN